MDSRVSPDVYIHLPIYVCVPGSSSSIAVGVFGPFSLFFFFIPFSSFFFILGLFPEWRKKVIGVRVRRPELGTADAVAADEI